ncbi:Nitrilotriacetate monooxygenase component A [Andreprevotia sp. IGB-42]|uniref:LLM class flavin-dependent oxidoreductase n=1 Tax=Andreprevotia sp. IGB-42 TaxID=2497473 RepID=UPI0013576043|nr:LLM class flavin-dependent oxidoreductase [Andreprevotia sp. IGB-42]KAF0815163.1 Nitrilotriacetate monooxygenase component A [Andreprevotia sp. IGB-42]
MSKRKEQIRLGAFLQATGHHVASWRHPQADADAGLNFEHYKAVTQLAERAKFDAIFLADGVGVRDRSTSVEALSRNGKLATFEPLTLFSALSAVTEHIGFIATASTSYNEPYHLARQFASLDWLSDGRAGWNVVTSGTEAEALNFNREKHFEHANRYERADEFVDVVGGLWDSWEDDAFKIDKESGVFFDQDKLHVLNHKGTHFSVKGPLNVARTPQGHPVIVQAGASEPGKELAARTAEVIFTAWQTLEEAQAFYADVKGRLTKFGRTPDQLKVMPGVFPVIGKTQEEAEAKYQLLQQLIHPSVGLALLGGVYGGKDLSSFELDAPPPPFPDDTNGSKSRLKLVRDLAEREGLTLRQLYERIAGARGHWTVVGTPEHIADQLQLWFENGAADGFNVMPPWLPGGLEEFVEHVVPILQQRGLFRTEYEGSTLRENLGLPYPHNRFAKGDAAATAAAAAQPETASAVA